MDGMNSIYSKEYQESICFYTDDLNYSNVVLGCGEDSGKPYNLVFDDENVFCYAEQIDE